MAALRMDRFLALACEKMSFPASADISVLVKADRFVERVPPKWDRLSRQLLSEQQSSSRLSLHFCFGNLRRVQDKR